MLEVLLFTYKDQFGEDFPLQDYSECTEIEVINVLYDCIQKNTPCRGNRMVENRFPEAPGQRKDRY